jgi:hypothetical protein
LGRNKAKSDKKPPSSTKPFTVGMKQGPDVNSEENDPELKREKARNDKIAMAAVRKLAGKSYTVRKVSSTYQTRCQPPLAPGLLYEENGSRMYGKKTLTLEWFNRYELVFEVENEEGTKETGYYIQVSTDVYGKLKPFATFYAIGKKEHWVLNDGEVNYSGNPYRSGLAPNECMGIYFVLTAGGPPTTIQIRLLQTKTTAWTGKHSYHRMTRQARRWVRRSCVFTCI